MGIIDSYLVTDPAFIQHVLSENQANYRKGPMYEKLQALIGTGLITSEAELWRKQRRLVQPVFDRHRLAGMLAVLDASIQRRCAMWSSRDPGQPVDIAREMTTLTMEIICVSLFGEQATDDMAETTASGIGFVEEVTREVVSLFHPLRQLFPRKPKPGPATAKLRKIITKLIDGPRSGGREFLTQLLQSRDEHGRGMSPTELLDEVLTLFVAGHETTATALSWTLWAIAKHGRVQQRLRNELAGHVEASGSCEQESLLRLTYPRMVVEEAMRLYPPVWSFTRQAINDDLIGGYRIPRGALVVLSPYVVQRLPTYWDNPEAFVPERFAPNRASERSRFVYFPFGAGPRMCAGNHFAMVEMQLVLARILQQFELDLVPNQSIEPLPMITLKPSAPIWMHLNPVRQASPQTERSHATA